MKLVPHSKRKKLQLLWGLLCLAPLLRLCYLDVHGVKLVVLGLTIPRENIYIFVLTCMLVVGIVVYYSIRFGRFFCAFLCPVHSYFEARYRLSWHSWSKILPWIIPPLLTMSSLTFLFSYSQLWAMLREEHFPQPILITFMIILGVMTGILVIYKENFCHSACPYAIFQNLIRTENTVVTVFDEDAKRCIDCEFCDRICPMQLNVRKQSLDSFCTNCTLCIDACAKVLGPEKEVIFQAREHEVEKLLVTQEKYGA